MQTDQPALPDGGPAARAPPLIEGDEKKAKNESQKPEDSSSKGIQSSSQPPERSVVLDWDGPNDPDNPHLWSPAKKLYHISVPAILGLVVSLGTSTYPPSVDDLSEHFHVSSEVGLVGLTLFVLGLGFGPIIGSPASETFGRKPVYLITIPLFGLFTLGVGFAKNIETALICRLLAGLFGGPSIAVGAGTNADLYSPDKRVITTATFSLGLFFATGIGPLIGSYVNARKDWRWVEWVLLFITAGGFVFSIFTTETYKKIILKRRAKATGAPSPTGPTGFAFLKSSLLVVLFRPIHMLCTEFVVMSFAIYVSFNFAVLFGFLAAVPLVFTTVYGFSDAESGLPFLAIAIGCVLSVPTLFLIDKTMYQKRYSTAISQGHKGLAPEYRLYGAMIGSIGIPISLFWFAWTAQKHVHWIVPIIGLVPFAWGNFSVFLSCVLYMVDTYMALNGASAMAANGLLRYIFGAVSPLFIVQMYNGMGFHWASSFLAFVSVVLLPVPWVLFIFGERIRRRSRYETWKE